MENTDLVMFWTNERRERIIRLYDMCENKETNFMKATKRIIDRLADADQHRIQEIISPITEGLA